MVKTHILKLTAKLESSYGCGLQYECDNAEEVDVCVVHSELHEDGLGVCIKPGVVIKVLQGSKESKTNPEF